MESVEKVYNDLIERIRQYNPSADFALIQKAFDVANKQHDGQMRFSGEPYIAHPVNVAYILAEMELDSAAIVAALLHDVVEDTEYSYEQINADFGEEITELVRGVTKLTKIPYSTKAEQQAENLRKMFMAMAKDIRVVLIKLADRLHNMRTLRSMTSKKQLEKACETMEIYAPLAHRLGMSKIKWELEDRSLRYLDPIAYKEIADNIAEKRESREEYLETIKTIISNKLNEANITFSLESRAKHFFSIYRKMYSQNIGIDQIYDLLAVRIIVESITDCYAVLGIVHEVFRPIPGRFKDYIAMPKSNMYKSLHTTLIGPTGTPFEVQIRTWDMHKIAEVGIAAHWKYKEGGAGDTEADNKFGWVRQLLEVYKNTNDAEELVTSLKTDLFEDEVFVFSPKGDLIDLPIGSNAIDFAYHIHSQIGDKTVGVKINGKMRPIDTKLKNGDIVEVITSKTSNGPSRDWLKIVATNQARRKINEFFKREQRDENITRGKSALERELKRNALYDIAMHNTDLWQPAVLKKYNLPNIDDMFAMLGYGGLSVLKVISKIKEQCNKLIEQKREEETVKELETQRSHHTEAQTQKRRNQEIIVHGIDNCLVRFAKCCNPVRGDQIRGYITRGRGVSIHRADCTNVQNDDPDYSERMIEVSWGEDAQASYLSNLKVVANNRTGLIANITSKISELKIPIHSVDARTVKSNTMIINLTLDIQSKEHLEKLTKKIAKLQGIISVDRSIN